MSGYMLNAPGRAGTEIPSPAVKDIDLVAMERRLARLVATPEQEEAYERERGEKNRAEAVRLARLRLETAGFGKREIIAAESAGGEFWLGKCAIALGKLMEGCLTVLHGDCGVGKTVMAARIASQWEPGRKVLYTRALNLLLAIKGTWRRDAAEGEEELIKRHARVPLLIIDEFQDRERSDSEWADAILTNIIDQRYSNMLPTLIISNRGYEETKGMMSTSVVSRAQQAGAFIELGGNSFRTRRQEI